MKPLFRIFVIVLLAIGLVGVRVYETFLFYDPLLVFFKSEHSSQPLPQFDTLNLLAFTALRFLMNTGISLALLWTLFQKPGYIKLASLLYAILFLVLMLSFILVLQFSSGAPHILLFYIRRFLIQPLFLLILIPAFYFQKRASA